MRATMSLPGIFPPVERDGRVLVDGGALNNVPADVVRAMGADVVIAVNVGFMGDTRDRQPFDARAHGTDRRRHDAGEHARRLQGGGHRHQPAARGLREPRLAAQRGARGGRLPRRRGDEGPAAAVRGRRSAMGGVSGGARAGAEAAWPTPQFVSVVGAVPSDQRAHRRGPRAGASDSRSTSTRSRRTSRRWPDSIGTRRWDGSSTRSKAGPDSGSKPRPKATRRRSSCWASSLQNTTTDDFTFQLAARYLRFDLVGSGSELRVDGAVGARAERRRGALSADREDAALRRGVRAVRRRHVNFVDDDAIVAQYSETGARGGSRSA